MQNFSLTPSELVGGCWRNRHLLFALVRREVVGRYRGSVAGMLWSLLTPLFMLAVYTFVFGVIFQAKWGVANESSASFALVLFSGLLVFNVFAECVNKAPSLITSNVNYVKKIVFPLELLAWVPLGSALFHFCVGFAVWMGFYVILQGVPTASMLFLPLVLLPVLLFTLGLSWLLASLGVYLRDLSQVVGVVTTALMFLSPIFYPASALREPFRSVLQWNPLAIAIEQVREVLIRGNPPPFTELLTHTVVACFVAWLGFVWFQNTRKGFADVL